MIDKTDSELLGAYESAGDQDAFAELVRRHGPMVYAAAARLLATTQDAEDAYQATFLALAKRSTQVRKREAIAGWLYTTAVRAANATLRRLKSSTATMRELDEMVGRPANAVETKGDPAARVETREELSALDEELSRLPLALRDAVVLCNLEGKSRREAADQIGISPNALQNRHTRALRILRQRLARRGVEVAAALIAAHAATQAATAATLPAALQTAALATKFAAGGSATTIGITPHLHGIARHVSASAVSTRLGAAIAIAAIALLGLRTSAESPRAMDVVSPRSAFEKDQPFVNYNWPPKSRVQMVHARRVFAGLPPGGGWVKQMSWRPDKDVPVGRTMSFGRLSVKLSVTQVDPSDISLMLSENLTEEQVVVYDGPWSASVIDTTMSGKRDFDIAIPFDTPFHYDPAKGNLIADVVFEYPGPDSNRILDLDFDVSSGEQIAIWTGDLGSESPLAVVTYWSCATQFSIEPAQPPSESQILAPGNFAFALATIAGCGWLGRRWWSRPARSTRRRPGTRTRNGTGTGGNL